MKDPLFAGFLGVYLGQLQTCPALILAVLAQAHNRVGLPKLTTIQSWVRVPIHRQLCAMDSRRIPSDHLLSPLCGLMVSRYRRGYAFTSTPEGRNCTCTKIQLSKIVRSSSLSPRALVRLGFQGNGSHLQRIVRPGKRFSTLLRAFQLSEKDGFGAFVLDKLKNDS